MFSNNFLVIILISCNHIIFNIFSFFISFNILFYFFCFNSSSIKTSWIVLLILNFLAIQKCYFIIINFLYNWLFFLFIFLDLDSISINILIFFSFEFKSWNFFSNILFLFVLKLFFFKFFNIILLFFFYH